MKLADIVVAEAIVPELNARTRDEAIAELVHALASAGVVPAARTAAVIKAVLDREAQATTGIGKGVALPHAKCRDVDRPRAAVGRSGTGVDFAALDGKAVYSILLLLSNPRQPDEHLQAMETIFKHVQRDMFRRFLRQSETRDAIVELIEEADELE